MRKAHTTEISHPSIPSFLEKRWGVDPAKSFDLLACVERKVWDTWDERYPVAPSIPLIRDERQRHGGYITVDWLVVRCPFCGDHHVHHDAMAMHGFVDAASALRHSLGCLGPHRSRCTKIRPLNLAGPYGTVYASARYFMVGIDRIPSTADLNSYFPMTDEFIVANDRVRASGYVYLVESNGFYKIGISSDPDKRIKSLQTATPLHIETVHIQESDRYQELEGELHAMFALQRVHGEWFCFADTEIDDVIAAMKGGAV